MTNSILLIHDRASIACLSHDWHHNSRHCSSNLVLVWFLLWTQGFVEVLLFARSKVRISVDPLSIYIIHNGGLILPFRWLPFYWASQCHACANNDSCITESSCFSFTRKIQITSSALAQKARWEQKQDESMKKRLLFLKGEARLLESVSVWDIEIHT